MIVAGTEQVGADFVGVHVATVIAPAGGFGDDGGVELVSAFAEARRGGSRCESAVAGEVALGAFGKLAEELGVLPEFLEEACRALVVVEGQDVVLDSFNGAFAVPNEEMKRAGRTTAARGVPVRV